MRCRRLQAHKTRLVKNEKKTDKKNKNDGHEKWMAIAIISQLGNLFEYEFQKNKLMLNRK